MKKRGISPLIATVLILGFTVALAAIIMTWGTGFTKRMQSQTEETSTVQISCATDVVFDVASACETTTGGTYKITVANNGNKKIDSFQIRFYESADSVITKTADFTSGIDAFGIESANVEAGATYANKIKQIDVIPVVTIGSKSITCAQNIGTFGDVTNTNAIDDCAA